MKDIALFRYHKDAEICNDRIDHILRFNPEIEIHGIYGGPLEQAGNYEKELSRLTTNYVIEGVPDRWKWQNFDFILKKWFIEHGKNLEFDRVVLYEWDYLLYGSIGEVYDHIPEGNIGITGITALQPIEHRWYWTSNTERYKEYKRLTEHLDEHYPGVKPTMACVCPGFILTYDFLTKMAQIDLPECGNDELRLPLYAQIAGTEMTDTGFFRKWFSNKEFRYFNCNDINVKVKTIRRQLKKPGGRRAFHPLRNIVKYDEVKSDLIK